MQVIAILKRLSLLVLLFFLQLGHIIVKLFKSVKFKITRKNYSNKQLKPLKSIAIILIMSESDGLWKRNKQLTWLIESVNNAIAWSERNDIKQLTIYEKSG